MNLYIDKAGRLVLPKSVRSRLGITPETALELVHDADGILLRRVTERPSMQQVDGLWVHQGTGIANADWAAAIDSVRNERADGGWSSRMLVFLDTSVLVAASESSHPHHAKALPVLRRVAKGEDRGFIGMHSIAETYAALTRLPVQPRIQPGEAGRIVRENILKHFTLIPAGEAEYLKALIAVQDGGWPGAKIYDALLLACAERSGAERIYTFNLGDFLRLAAPELRARICSP